MNPLANCSLAAVLMLGTAVWLLLLLSSLLFAPSQGKMRLREKSLLVVSVILLIAWCALWLSGNGGH